MRRLASLLALAAPLWALTLDCNTPQDGFLQPPTIVTDPRNPPTSVDYTVSGAAGETVLIRLVYVTKDPNFKPRLLVHGPTSALVPARPTKAGAGADVAQEYTFTDAGDQTVEVQATSITAGNYRIQMVRLNHPCANAVLACGAPASGQLSGALDVRTYRFDAAANDTVGFQLVKTGPFQPVNNQAPAPTNLNLLVYGPDGLLMQTPDAHDAITAQCPGACASTQNRISLTVKSPAAGPVTALVLDQNNNAAQFAVSGSRLNGACGDKILACGSAADASIQAPAQVDGYTVSANAGDVYSVKLVRSDSSGSFVPVGEVYDPSGKLLVTVSPTATSSHSLAVGAFTAAATGKYTILARDSTDGTRQGGYTVALNRVNQPCGTVTGLGCSSVIDSKIDGTLRQNTYSLPASANDSFLVRLLHTGSSPNFNPRVDIYDTQGNALQTVATADLARVNFTVPTDGTYTVVVSDNFDGTQSGAYSLASVRVSRPCNAAPLDCAKVLTGSIDGPLRFSSYSYNAAGGESFTVRMLSPGGSLKPDVEIYSPSGQKVGTDVSGNVRAYDVYRPSAGVYTLIALDSSKTPGQGPFGIDVLRTKNVCGASLAMGQPAGGVVSGTAPFVSYSVPVNAGDQMQVRSAAYTPGFSALMELYDGDGVRLDGGTYSLSRRAAAAGPYTVIVSGSSPNTAGAFSVSWQSLNNPANAPPLACGGTASGSLGSPAGFRYYLAGLSAGDTAKLLLTRVSDNFAPQMELYDPSGTRVAAAGAEVVQKVRADGSYLVVVAPSTASGETGGYSLALQRPNNPCSPAPLACGQSLLRSIGVAGQLDALTFSGNAGDLTTLKMPVRSGSLAPFAELYDSSGNLVRTSSTGTLSLALPLNGSYTVFVRDRNGTGTGTYRAQLQTDPACPVTDKEPPTITLLRPTGGEVIAGGSAFHIAWQSDDNVDVAGHEIRLSTDGGKTFPTVIASNLSGVAQSYDWAVPAGIAPSRSAVMRVTATDAAGNSQSAVSDTLAVIGSGFTENTSVSLAYDPLNRIVQAAYGDGRTLQYTYDSAGNLVQITVSGQ